MWDFKILVEGYAHSVDDNIYAASPTSTLLLKGKDKILVDPGTNSELLARALDKENLKPSDIKLIFLSHYHPDHFLNLKFFPYAEVLDGTIRWVNDKEYMSTENIKKPELEIISTPGHALEHSSILFDHQEYGKVCIAADVFWWEDGEQKTDNYMDLCDHKDPFACDVIALKNSRITVLERADYIIPGHGKPFKNLFKNYKKKK